MHINNWLKCKYIFLQSLVAAANAYWGEGLLIISGAAVQGKKRLIKLKKKKKKKKKLL
jgi:hypothetical protein